MQVLLPTAFPTIPSTSGCCESRMRLGYQRMYVQRACQGSEVVNLTRLKPGRSGGSVSCDRHGLGEGRCKRRLKYRCVEQEAISI